MMLLFYSPNVEWAKQSYQKYHVLLEEKRRVTGIKLERNVKEQVASWKNKRHKIFINLMKYFSYDKRK